MTIGFSQTEIDRLKRRIAEKEAAVRASQVQLPAVTKVSCVHDLLV